MTTLAGAHQILEYGAATKLYILNNIQDMLMIMKKRDSQDSAGSESEHKHSWSGDVAFLNGP
jgi:hypothetical protein